MLSTLLRRLRWAEVLVVAEVPETTQMLGLLDLILCLSADKICTCSGSSDTVIDTTLDSISIAWDDGLRFPALTEAAMRLWKDAITPEEAERTPKPMQLNHLNQAGLIQTTGSVMSMSSSVAMMQPSFLLGLRRSVALKIGRMDKTAFNFYWVTKVGQLNSMPKPEVDACGGVEDVVEASLDEQSGTLHVMLRSLHVEPTKVQGTLAPLLSKTSQVLVTIAPPKSSGTPAQFVTTTNYKYHRKWELMLQGMCEKLPVAVKLLGQASVQLMELFFAADARALGEDVSTVGFAASGFLPGPHAMRSLSHFGHSTVKSVICGSVKRDKALALGLAIDADDAQLLEAAVRAFGVRAASAPNKPCTNLCQLLRSSPTATPSPLIAASGLANGPLALMTGLALTLPPREHEFTQAEVAKRLGLEGSKLGDIFGADHIKRRTIAELKTCDLVPGQGVLTERHLKWARALLASAVQRACDDAGCNIADVDCLVVCSSTGYLLPGLTAYVVKDAGMSRGVARFDVVGMGCHAGLNSLKTAASWAKAHPGRIAIAAGVEICSAHFIWPDACQNGGKMDAEKINHAVCNSLFSDGCFAATLVSPPTGRDVVERLSNVLEGTPRHYVALHDFASVTAHDAMDTMEYRWHDVAGQFWFYLSELAPYAVGAGLSELRGQLDSKGLPIDHCRHWVTHTGGQTVIDAAASSLGVDLCELAPTSRALAKYGNNSSTSFLFAFSEFFDNPPSPVLAGHQGAFVTMGPGAGLESCLWVAGDRLAQHASRSVKDAHDTFFVHRIVEPGTQDVMPVVPRTPASDEIKSPATPQTPEVA